MADDKYKWLPCLVSSVAVIALQRKAAEKVWLPCLVCSVAVTALQRSAAEKVWLHCLFSCCHCAAKESSREGVVALFVQLLSLRCKGQEQRWTVDHQLEADS